MSTDSGWAFDAPDLFAQLQSAEDADLDTLTFGVIGFAADGNVRRYNKFESEAAGLSLQRVIGYALFTLVAPCMNNYLVAQRFEDAQREEAILDDIIDYVLTLRMRPTRVKLRLLAHPDAAMRYVLVRRSV